MTRARLRIFYGPPSHSQDERAESAENAEHSDAPRRTVEVTLGEIFPVLVDAVRGRRTWLHDFEDDVMTISTDLYEALLAYQHYRRPSA